MVKRSTKRLVTLAMVWLRHHNQGFLEKWWRDFSYGAAVNVLDDLKKGSSPQLP